MSKLATEYFPKLIYITKQGTQMFIVAGVYLFIKSNYTSIKQFEMKNVIIYDLSNIFYSWTYYDNKRSWNWNLYYVEYLRIVIDKVRNREGDRIRER